MTDTSHVYYNVSIRNGSNVELPATFSDNRTVPIINTPSDYFLSVIRFSCPTNSIPIMIVPIQKYPNIDPTLTIFSVTLEYDGFVAQQYVVWETTQKQSLTTMRTPYRAISASNLYQDSGDNYYHLYSFQHMVNLVNTAFEDAFTTLGGLVALPAGSSAPYFTFNSSTDLFTLVAQQANYDVVNVATPIKVFVNNPLFGLFGAINANKQLNAPDGREYQYLITNTNNNVSGGLISMVQEYPCLVNWLGFQSLVFMTGTVPIVSEQIPASQNYFSAGNAQSDGLPVMKPILTDFNPASTVGTENLNSIQYTPSGEYRLIDLQSDRPLDKFDVSVFWQDRYGNLYNLYLLPNECVTIKFMFVHKSLYGLKPSKN